MNSISAPMQAMAGFIASAKSRSLPPPVAAKARQHLLDSIAAMVSGAVLHPGQLAIAYAARQGGRREACVPGSRLVTSAVNAALVESYPELRPWMPWAQHVHALEESEKHCREAQAKWHSREMIDFCFFDKSDGRFVGKGGLHTIDWAIPKFEIGYWIRSSCTRRGMATEAAVS